MAIIPLKLKTEYRVDFERESFFAFMQSDDNDIVLIDELDQSGLISDIQYDHFYAPCLCFYVESVNDTDSTWKRLANIFESHGLKPVQK